MPDYHLELQCAIPHKGFVELCCLEPSLLGTSVAARRGTWARAEGCSTLRSSRSGNPLPAGRVAGSLLWRGSFQYRLPAGPQTPDSRTSQFAFRARRKDDGELEVAFLGHNAWKASRSTAQPDLHHQSGTMHTLPDCAALAIA